MRPLFISFTCIAALLVAGCSNSGAGSASTPISTPAPAPSAAQATKTAEIGDRAATLEVAQTPGSAVKADASLPVLRVHKSPTCGCCELWIEHMKAAGFSVEVFNTQDMIAVKQRVGLTPDQASCHTTEVEGYFVEGHVPAEDVKRLLAERPEALGLAVPGMPLGSPGMEAGNQRQPYDTLLVKKEGTEVFARHNQP